MKVLIIDNETSNLTALKSLFKKDDLTIIQTSSTNQINSDLYDLIVLSGSRSIPIYGNEKYYESEIALIKESKTPIIGICIGFELICHAYGANLIRLDQKVKRTVQINAREGHYLFKDIPNFDVYEAHIWVVLEAPNQFDQLAFSDNGVEIIKHKQRDLYGFQFHPELGKDNSGGDEIFQNTIDYIFRNN